MQVDRIVYFAILLSRCVKAREPISDALASRRFEEALSSFKMKHRIEEGYEQNERSIQYLITMAKELGIIFRNNKLTPWGITLNFFTPTREIPIALPSEFKLFFLKCFLLENYAFVKSLYDHIRNFPEIRDEYSWYRRIDRLPKDELSNHAFSVYIYALKIASMSVDSLAMRRRYLRLYRQTLKKGKTAKALYPKIKPSLGLMEDLDLIKERRDNDKRILLWEKNGHKPYSRILDRLSDYKMVVNTIERGKENLLPIFLEAFGFTGRNILSNQEIMSDIETLYEKLRDPVFKACDINVLVDITVIQKGLQGYQLNESEVKEAIIKASRKDTYRYQLLPDRYGKYRFLKIKP